MLPELPYCVTSITPALHARELLSSKQARVRTSCWNGHVLPAVGTVVHRIMRLCRLVLVPGLLLPTALCPCSSHAAS